MGFSDTFEDFLNDSETSEISIAEWEDNDGPPTRNLIKSGLETMDMADEETVDNLLEAILGKGMVEGVS